MAEPAKICHCGNCETVMSRVTETVRKQLLDGECPVFIVAHSLAWAEIGIVFAHNLVLENPHETAKITGALAYLQRILERELQSGDYIQRLQEAVKAYHKVQQGERNLPKGD